MHCRRRIDYYLACSAGKDCSLWGNHRKSRPQIYFDFDLHSSRKMFQGRRNATNSIPSSFALGAFGKLDVLYLEIEKNVECDATKPTPQYITGSGITASSIYPWYVLYTASAFPDQPVQSGKSAINNPQPGRGVVSPSPPTKYVEKSEKRRVRQ